MSIEAPSTDSIEDVFELDKGPEVVLGDNDKLLIVVDHERVREVLDTLLDAYETRSFPYDSEKVMVPQDPRNMPDKEILERGSVDHAMFFWNVCYYMRGGVKSVDAVGRLSEMYKSYPELFDSSTVVEFTEDQIAQILTENGLGFQKTVSKLWVENSKLMNERWGGDPRNMFKGVDNYEDALKVVQNDGKGGGFKGFQEKMTSMILYYLMDEGLIEPFMFPIPVDLHVLRVSIANELITFPNAPYGTNLYTPKTLEVLRKIYYEYARDHDVNPLRLCDAVWLLSEAVCGKHPGNITLEPEGRKNRDKGRRTVLIPEVVNTDDYRQQNVFAETCAKCSLNKLCKYNLPGKPYYVSGSLHIRGIRETGFPPPAQGTLFS